MNEINNVILAMTGIVVLMFGSLWLVAWVSRGKHFAYTGIAFTTVICCGGYFVIPQAPVYEYHHVRVVKVIDPYVWLLAKEDGEFKANFCHDYDLSKGYDAVPGNIMKKLRYEDFGVCISIRREDLGFWWARDQITGKAIIEPN